MLRWASIDDTTFAGCCGCCCGCFFFFFRGIKTFADATVDEVVDIVAAVAALELDKLGKSSSYRGFARLVVDSAAAGDEGDVAAAVSAANSDDDDDRTVDCCLSK